MALSLDLISEFVKITKDQTPQKQETITYGTVVKSDESTYVKIDGAEVLTPIISTTNLADKERVTVMIKNHTAIVTGNITTPAARTAEVEDVAKELAKTKILIADKVSTAELEAQKGRIDYLEANEVTISGKVTANEGEIKYLKSDEFSAKQITAISARIEEIASKKLTTDELYVALAEITVLAAGTATFDKATIQHLVAEAMNLKYGVADQVFIENLAVEYAQMVGATIGNLCVKASDGKYYTIDISPDGNVTATLTTVTEGEANAGQTNGGKVILETNIAADNLNASNLLATYALINSIDAARIDVDQLFAREAFVNLLRTTKIVGDKTITMIAEDAEGGAVQIVEGASGQAECREGKGIYIYSDFEPKQDLSGGFVSGREGLNVDINDSSFAIQFGAIIYGGHYDWQTGELLVTWGSTTIGSLSWYKGGSGYTERFQTSLPGVEIISDNTNDPNVMCDVFRTEKWSIATTTDANNVIMQAGGSDIIAIKCSAYADVASFLAAVKDEKIVYKLAEPYLIKYARQQFLSHEGVNTVQTDADNGRIEFGHDPMDFRIESIEFAQGDMKDKQDALDEEQKRVSTYFRIEPEMVRIGKEGVTSEFRIDPWGAGVAINNTVFSRFESDRVRIGNMEIRRPAVGGLAFDSIADEIGVSM